MNEQQLVSNIAYLKDVLAAVAQAIVENELELEPLKLAQNEAQLSLPGVK